jgi:acetylornithine deacetylase/succinyl-diaminopimelate desuccinylase
MIELPRAISDAIDRSGWVELMADLVRAPSHRGIERQEERVVEVLARWLRSRGVDAETIEVAPGRPNLLARVRGRERGRQLLLCGHTDTVRLNEDDPGDGFSAEQRDGRMFGRGTADMKGALAAMASTLVALEASSALRSGGVTLAAVIDEEMESLGAEHLVHSGLYADGAVIGEATANRLALGHRGLEWLELDFAGRSAHGGAPDAGISAIQGAARFIHLVGAELSPRLATRTHPLLGPATINFGTIHGGDQPSTIAAFCRLTADRRTIPGENWDGVRAELRALLDRVQAELPGLVAEIRRMPGGMATMEHGAVAIDPEHPLARAAAEACAAVRGRREPPVAFPAWSDAALLANQGGIPTVVLGPGDLALAHSPRESIALAEVAEAARIYAACALGFCAIAGSER